MKRDGISFIAALLLTVVWAVGAYAGGADWRSEYADVIKAKINDNNNFQGNVFQLADIDVDGMPELLIGKHPGTGMFSELENLYAFKNGQIVEPVVKSGILLGSPYELYRNYVTGDVRIMGGYVIRNGWMYHSSVSGVYRFSDTVSFERIFEKKKEVSSTDYTERYTYYIYGTETSEADYDNAIAVFGNGWEKIPDYSYKEMAIGYGGNAEKVDEFIYSYADGPAKSVASTHRIEINGTQVKPAGYIIGDNNYYKLRDIASLLSETGSKFEIGYNSADKSVAVTSGQSYTPVGGELDVSGIKKSTIALASASIMYVNGTKTALKAYNIDGNNYFKLRDLGSAIGFGIEWNAETATVKITA